MSEKRFLTFDLINGCTSRVAIPPISSIESLIIPSIDVTDIECKYASLKISSDGSIITPWNSDNACEKSHILVPYISSFRGTHSVDLDLACSFPTNFGLVEILVTKPYPGDLTQGKLIVFTGQFVSATSDRIDDLFTLPPELKPSENLHFLCSENGHYVSITKDTGTVSLVSPTSQATTVSLENVKFHIPISNSARSQKIQVIKPGLPNRPNILILNSSSVDQYLIVPNESALIAKPILVSLTVFRDDTSACELSVACVRYGELEVLGRVGGNQTLFLPESLITAKPLKTDDVLCPMMDGPIDDKSMTQLTEMIVEKITPVVYSRLSGESELRCLAKYARRKIAQN